MNPDTFVTVGKIVGVHGIKGYVKIHCEADSFSDLCTRPCRDCPGFERRTAV